MRATAMPTTPTQTTPTRTTPSSLALDRALAPVESEGFLAEHWERKPLVVPRAEEGRFDDLLSVADVERLITETGIRAPGVSARQGGRDGVAATPRTCLGGRSPSAVWRTSRRVLAEFEAARRSSCRAYTTTGCRSPATAGCSRRFSATPLRRTRTTRRRAPRASPVHHDTHEVISLQVAGEKRWLVYEPVLELPLKNQRYRSELGAPGEPVLDVTLRAGDTMYLPRGWLHQALTSELRLTAHHRRRQRPPLDRRSARRTRPAGARSSPSARRSTATSLPSCPVLDAEAVRLRARGALRPQQAADPGRPAVRAALARQAHGRDGARRRDTVIADLHGTQLVFEGRDLSFPERLAAELEFLSRRRDPSARPRCRALWTRPGDSCCSGGSCARASCDVAIRPLERRSRAGEVSGLTQLAVHIHLVDRSTGFDLRPPALAGAIDRAHAHV